MSVLNKISLLFIFYLMIIITCSSYSLSKEVNIVVKIDDEIITNVDVENEYKYLTALNVSFKDIEKEKILNLSKKSLIREKIKKIELIKYYELDKKNETIDNMISSIYKNIGLNSLAEFKNYLNSQNLNFEDIYKKIEIETVWNQMIYSRFKEKVVINEENLKKKIMNNNEKTESFLLYELIFDFKNREEIDNKYEQILKNIKTEGFKKTVIKYSVVDSKNKSGLVGWVKKNALSDRIKDGFVSFDIGEVSEPINLPSGVLLLKIEDKKLENISIDKDKELEKLVKFELNNQLNNYSTMLFNKVKKEIVINEY